VFSHLNKIKSKLINPPIKRILLTEMKYFPLNLMFNSNQINFKKSIEVSQKQGIPIFNLNAQIIIKFACKKEIKKFIT